jgi:hypothetical protein
MPVESATGMDSVSGFPSNLNLIVKLDLAKKLSVTPEQFGQRTRVILVNLKLFYQQGDGVSSFLTILLTSILDPSYPQLSSAV